MFEQILERVAVRRSEARDEAAGLAQSLFRADAHGVRISHNRHMLRVPRVVNRKADHGREPNDIVERQNQICQRALLGGWPKEQVMRE